MLPLAALIRNVQPSQGSVLIEIEAGEYARYGYLNALVIEARDQHKEIRGASTNARMLAAVEEEEEPVVEALSPSLALYPNPVQADLNIAYDASKEGKCLLQIMDLSGRLMYSQELDAQEGHNTYTLDLGQTLIDKGIYILRIKSESSESRAIRFIKQ